MSESAQPAESRANARQKTRFKAVVAPCATDIDGMQHFSMLLAHRNQCVKGVRYYFEDARNITYPILHAPENEGAPAYFYNILAKLFRTMAEKELPSLASTFRIIKILMEAIVFEVDCMQETLEDGDHIKWGDYLRPHHVKLPQLVQVSRQDLFVGSNVYEYDEPELAGLDPSTHVFSHEHAYRFYTFRNRDAPHAQFVHYVTFSVFQPGASHADSEQYDAERQQIFYTVQTPTKTKNDTDIYYRINTSSDIFRSQQQYISGAFPGFFTGGVVLLRLTMGKRERHHTYDDCVSLNENVIKIAVGQWDSRLSQRDPFKTYSFVTADNRQLSHMAYKDQALQKLIFDSQDWPSDRYDLHQHLMRVSAPSRQQVVDADDVNRGGDTKLRFNFKNIDEKMCLMSKKETSGDDNQQVGEVFANFWISEVLAVLQSSEQNKVPSMHKVMCQHRLRPMLEDGYDNVFTLRVEDVNRSTLLEGYTLLQVEVLITLGKLTNDNKVRQIFNSAHALLKCTLTPAMLTSFLMTAEHLQPLPFPQSVIVRWGRQLDGWFVLQNCAFKNGKVLPLRESQHEVSPEVFTGDKRVPMKPEYFPRMTYIPFKHVRYTIAVNFYCDIMPRFFLRNIEQAYNVFALTLMGMHANAFWAGESGAGHGFPVAYIVSPEFNTGKTEACIVAKSLNGHANAKLLNGKATIAGLAQVLSQQADCTRVVDDMMPQNKDYEFGEKVRMIYDQVGRCVVNEEGITVPLSGVMFTSNYFINKNDAAMHSKMLTFVFHAKDLRGNEIADDDEVYTEYTNYLPLLSSLMPDLEMLGKFEGKLDREAIQDCCAFMNKVCKQKRDRSLNSWGALLYFRIVLNALVQGYRERLENIFEHFVVETARQSRELHSFGGLFEQFLINLLHAHEDVHTNPQTSDPAKVLSYHTLRTTEKPPVFGGSHTWWAIRIKPACALLNYMCTTPSSIGRLRAFDGEEVAQHALNMIKAGYSDQIIFGKCMFWNARIWPAEKTIAIAGVEKRVPLLETELNPDDMANTRPGEMYNDCMEKHDCIWVRTDMLKTFRRELGRENLHGDIDYKSVMIKSSNPDIGQYCFYKQVVDFYECDPGDTSSAWFGYRTLSESTFADYCGVNNLLLVQLDNPKLQDGFDLHEVQRYMNPSRIRDYFNYDFPTQTAITYMPDIYTQSCYKFVLDNDDSDGASSRGGHGGGGGGGGYNDDDDDQHGNDYDVHNGDFWEGDEQVENELHDDAFNMSQVNTSLEATPIKEKGEGATQAKRKRQIHISEDEGEDESSGGEPEPEEEDSGISLSDDSDESPSDEDSDQVADSEPNSLAKRCLTLS